MVAGSPSFRTDGHRSGSKVLHLFQVEVHGTRQHGQLGHVFFRTSGVAADEIGNDLLAQPCIAVDALENLLE